MASYTDSLTLTQWAGIATLACAAITILGFVLQWGIRFRLVGATGFLVVLTGGIFALTLVPFTRTVVPGAVRFSLIYDTGATQTVIAVPPKISHDQLEATLRQAASDLYSYGRLGRDEDKLTIRARTVIHPDPGVSQPLYLGQVKRSLTNRNDEQMAIEIYQDKLALIADDV
ncbi:MAG: Ycf51 family protein [Chroococcidiopsidaceae cyanobacterium CP_BM_ER_R8_30]|nr:Ycf51 family protein [Chroococcidiopsidaceae cyanobacterium CP_BM_ER_R8_30]